MTETGKRADAMESRQRLRVVFVEDNSEDAKLIARMLEESGYNLESKRVDKPESLEEYVAEADPDLVISDYNLPGWTAIDALDILKRSGKVIPIIVVSGSLGDEIAAECIKQGAIDYVLKDRMARLPYAIAHALENKASIQKQRASEAALRESEERYRLLLDSTAEGIYGLDLKGICTFSNRSCVRMLGYRSAGDLLGKKMHALAHHTRKDGTAYPEQECPIYAAIREAQGAHVVDEVLWRADGSSFPAEYWSYPMYHNGAVVGSVVTFLDISERKSAEEQLKHSEERYRLLFQANPQPTFLYDAKTFRFLAVNEAAIRHYGYSYDEFLCLSVMDIRLPEDVPKLLEAAAARARDGEVSGPVDAGLWRHRRKDGSLIDVDVTIHHFGLAGRDAVLAVITDVTEKLLLEKQFRQAQKMEAVGRLAGGIAHDFNNLLGIILGYSDLLLLDRTLGDQARHRLEEISKAGQRAVGLTRQLLAFSRKQVLESRTLNLNELIKSTTGMLQRLLGEDVALMTELDPKLGLVHVDPAQIEQIVMNLAVNSRDAMPDGGELTIQTSNVELDDAYGERHMRVPPGHYIMLAVTDNGSGIDAETQKLIFEPFFTTKSAERGTGLGLSTAYGIVKQSGGYIWVYSEVGMGTTFKIYLPRVEGKAEILSRDPQSHAIERGSETILLVEDDASLRALDRELLEEMGYEVLDASRGSEALTISGRMPDTIHLLMTDVIMPGMNGKELAEQLLESRPNTKVLYVSGYADNIIQNVISSPGASFLQKPFTRQVLSKKLREVLPKRPENDVTRSSDSEGEGNG